MFDKFDIDKLVNFTKTLKVLFVEDNEEARVAILALLSNFFDDIAVAKDGKEGISLFKADSFDIIISDIRMPNTNGLEMIEQIRQINNSVPVIISTAHKETDLLLESIKLGVNGYLLKPINFKQLKQVIKQICEKIYYKRKAKQYEENLEKLVNERTQELEIAKSKLVEMANKDPLTNLYNRRYFNDVADTLLSMAHRQQQEFSIFMLDIDRFKLINDTYGHNAGDVVLKKLSNLLTTSIRQSDVAIRFGGEEFVVLLPNTNIDGAVLIAKKLKEAIENIEIKIPNIDIIKFTVSIGISQCDCSKNAEVIDDLVHKADEALYEAKRAGRNKIVIYSTQTIV
jgi:diguanylate cyclase (GGDEF)-like protein